MKSMTNNFQRTANQDSNLARDGHGAHRVPGRGRWSLANPVIDLMYTLILSANVGIYPL